MQLNDKEIESVILDLGGVILNIDYVRTIEEFQKLGFENFDLQYSQLTQSGIFDRLETGMLSENEFIDLIKLEIPHASEAEIIFAWNALLLDFPPGRIETVKRIANSFPTFLLSNTNAIHYKAFNKTLFTQTGVADIKSLFKHAYLSHEIGMRKPNHEAFQLIIEQNNLDASRTLFVDDSPQHIKAALEVGLITHHLTGTESLEELFRPLLT